MMPLLSDPWYFAWHFRKLNVGDQVNGAFVHMAPSTILLG